MAGRKVLLVDPDAASRAYLSRQLAGQGYEVLQASTAGEGLASAARDLPDVIIADPVVSDVPAEEFARRLRGDARTASAQLIALSSASAPARKPACLQAGFDTYIQKSSRAMAELSAALEAPPRQAIPAPGQPGPAPAPMATPSVAAEPTAAARGAVIVFLSAKGGTGTSSLCANLAMNIAAHQPDARVAVVDMVLPIGSIASMVGYRGTLDLVQVADMPADQLTPEFFNGALKPLPGWRLHLLAGCPDPECSHRLNVATVPKILSALQQAFDFVLIDIGRALSRITLPIIRQADLIALIVSTDHSTVAHTKTVWDYLRSQGIDSAGVFSILNRAVGLEGLTKAEAESIIGLTINTAMPYLGGDMALANNLHEPLSTKFPGNTATIILEDAAKQMVRQARRLRE